MGRIRLLSDLVASQVAAGEVVERPSSVLKELVENSLDAGAKRIEIEIARGGTGFVRVTDDGCGMERDDALLCLERHATSKISTAKDLARIETFGFRGEAIPSIASVSRFRLATRTHDATVGTEILVEGGKVLDVRDCGEPAGTTVEVQSLFFNLPARRKFLRSELTETGHLMQQFYNAALAHPEIAFVLLRDGKLIHQLAATDDLRVRARDLFGKEWLERTILAPEFERDGIRVSGLIARPSFTRLDRSQQFVFLNRRAVSDAAITRGLREAYAGLDKDCLHPIGAIFLQMDASAFDCNVHPTKREVRFHRPDLVREAVYEFAKNALRAPVRKGASYVQSFSQIKKELLTKPTPMPHELAPSISSEASNEKSACAPSEANVASARHDEAQIAQQAPMAISASEIPQTLDWIAQAESASSQARNATVEPDSDSEWPTGERFVFRGPLGDRYWLLENPDGLVLLDLKHAAERIFYEELLRARSREGYPAQRLLVTETPVVSPQDYAWIAENTEVLHSVGMWVEPFGGGAIKIEAVPAGMDAWAPSELLLRLLDEIRAGTRASARRFVQDQIALAMSRMLASRFEPPSIETHDPLQFVRRLFNCDLPYATPSGRPVIIQISWSELRKKFS